MLARPTKCRRSLNFRCRGPQYIGFVERAMTSSDLGARFRYLDSTPMPALRQLSRSLPIAFAVDRWSALSSRHLQCGVIRIHIWHFTVHQSHWVAVVLKPSTALPSGLPLLLQRVVPYLEWPSELEPGPVLVALSIRCIRSLRQPISSWAPARLKRGVRCGLSPMD